MHITRDELMYAYHYDPATGIFTHKSKKKGYFVGSVAGTLRNERIAIGLKRRIYLAHRLAWMYVYGELPNGHLDHIDGNPTNNCISNLRECTQAQNAQNKRAALSNSQSQLLGVTWHKWSSQWRATIGKSRKQTHLGYFKTKEEAHVAYLKAKRTVHEFCTI